MANEKEIFEGKTFQDLTKDIYENTTKRKTQIDLLESYLNHKVNQMNQCY